MVDKPSYSKQIYGKPKRGMVFYFCGWKMPFWVYEPIFFIVNRAGYGVHAYSFADHNIMDCDNLGTVAQLGEVVEDVRVEIRDLKAHGINFFACFGNSLGSEIALGVAKQVPDIAAVILNTVRGSTSKWIWTTEFARYWRRIYESRGYTEAKLYTELKPLEPIDSLDKLGDRPVLVYYSKADKIIPARSTKLLIRTMAAEHVQHKIIVNRFLGHYGASAKNHLYFWRWLGFLRQAELEATQPGIA